MLSDVVGSVVDITAEIAEVDSQSILSDCRQSEVVEARMIAVKILSDMGYSPQRLSKYFHKSEQGIRVILSAYYDRQNCNPLFLRMEKEIRNKLSIK